MTIEPTACACGCGRLFTRVDGWDGMHNYGAAYVAPTTGSTDGDRARLAEIRGHFAPYSEVPLTRADCADLLRMAEDDIAAREEVERLGSVPPYRAGVISELETERNIAREVAVEWRERFEECNRRSQVTLQINGDLLAEVERLGEHIAACDEIAAEHEAAVERVRAVARGSANPWPDLSWPPDKRAAYLDGWDAAIKATLCALDVPQTEETT